MKNYGIKFFKCFVMKRLKESQSRKYFKSKNTHNQMLSLESTQNFLLILHQWLHLDVRNFFYSWKKVILKPVCLRAQINLEDLLFN